jgi:uncharacterized protein (TIGR03066 family)
MNALRLAAVLACLATLGLSPAWAAPEKDTNKDKIIGTWEVVKSQSDLPAGSTVEFTKDGKLTVTVKAEDKKVVVKGTYKVDGDTLTVTTKDGDEEHTEKMTIKSLTKDKLVVVDDKKKTDELKKK